MSTDRRSTADTVVGALVDQAARFPDDTFLVCGDDVLTFGGACEVAGRIAAGLADVGLEAGDRVAIIAENDLDVVAVNFGIAWAGMISVPINVFLKGEFLRHQLVNSGAVAVFHDAVGADILRPVLADLPDLRVAVRLVGDGADLGFTGTSADIAELRAADPVPPVACSSNDLLQILYTSGTTGPSKGCMLSHASRVRAGNTVSDVLEVIDQDVLIGVAPMFHMGGQMNVAIALMAGIPLAMERAFSASGFLDRAREVGATLMAGVGNFAMFLLDQPALPTDREHPLRAWLAVPLPPDAVAEMQRRFGITAISQLYAQTEAMPITCGRLSDPGVPGSAGPVLPDVEVAIVDDDDALLPAGAVGEIVVRPKVPGAIYSGYWNNPEATVAAWRNLWHHTGDLGRLDDAGVLTYVDRKKDYMRRRGENVSAFELEQALLAFPAIAEVAAIGARHPDELEDEIKACVVLAEGEAFDPAAFATFALDSLPYYAVPRFIDVLESLPRNPTGRVMKFQLRELPAVSDGTHDLLALGLVTGRKPRPTT